ncbi:hypothetical protein D6829_00345 [Candidatus Pacearchaeota archaeon]|nr:MAG: hypothetical protein D6829_00345 [Candidatus Pacearchaeota archaeon]
MERKYLAALALIALMFPLALAQTNSSNSTQNTKTTSKDKIQKGFTCLEDAVLDCSKLSVQEIALTILATPGTETIEDCIDELETRAENDNFGNIRDTALAILALNHVGRDTKPYENWLLKQEESPSDLIWYLQQDSSEEVTCTIKYGSTSGDVSIGKDKKVSSGVGSCLQPSSSGFWLRIDPSCYGTEFEISCDQNFIANLLYKSDSSPVIHIVEDLSSRKSAGDSATLKVISKCFGDPCDYEATAWASLALLRTKHPIDAYIPYLIALAKKNEGFLPNALILMITGEEEFANKLMEEQNLAGYWKAKSSNYDKIYDTSLALLASARVSSSEKVKKARSYLLFLQKSSGCWAEGSDKIRDTAIALWALSGRTYRKGSSIVDCKEAGFFCVPKADCEGTDVLRNYYCGYSSYFSCCKKKVEKTCSQKKGKICPLGKKCSGEEVETTDTTKCCLSSCVEKTEEKSECESKGSSYSCKTSCSSSERKVSYACDEGDVCCKKTSGPVKPNNGGKSSTGIIIVLVILIGLVVLGIIYREKLKMWIMKRKYEKSKGQSGPAGFRPGAPPREGPPRPPRPPRPPMPPTRSPLPPRPIPGKDKEMSDTFRKLREMSR